MVYLPTAVAAYYCEILAVMDKDIIGQILVERDIMPTAQYELATSQIGQLFYELIYRLILYSLDLSHIFSPPVVSGSESSISFNIFSVSDKTFNAAE